MAHSKRSHPPLTAQGSLFDHLHETPWPPQELFPLNRKASPERLTVKSLVHRDLDRSRAFLIVTGFTSLSHIIDTFGTAEAASDMRVRILLGVEPEVRGRKQWARAQLEDTIKEYWIDKGISPFKCGAVVRTIELIKSGALHFRILDHVHAKLYVGATHATLGSSNFSINGLSKQREANVRFAHNGEHPRDTELADGVRQVAENYFADGTPFDDGMIALLEAILQKVDWQEALARSIAEVLEGRWLQEYTALREHLDRLKLWPSQWQGVARGLQILREQGNLLVADPTGSGKTKMISALQLALTHSRWAMGQGDRTQTAVICPPVVMDNWDEEQLTNNLSARQPISHGVLSAKAGRRKEKARKQIAQSRILVMDEAHNYLNPGTNRSRMLEGHQADHVVLSTATPINRRAEDLLRLVELLDPDNLSDDELKEYQRLRKQRPLVHDPETMDRLRSYIWRFTLRRTKKELNRMIDAEPEHYLNHLGKPCRYPEHVASTYQTGGSAKDIQDAERINALADELHGLIYLRTIHRPYDRALDTSEHIANHVDNRLSAAKALARFRLNAALRSSRVALVEHVHGTNEAMKMLGIKGEKKVSGNALHTLGKMGLPKVDRLFVPYLPEWLTDELAFSAACVREQKLYEQMAELARNMSTEREHNKAKQLLAAVKQHGVVVAFDHTVVSLHQIAKFLDRNGGPRFAIAAGDRDQKRDRILDDLKLEATTTNLVVLCSDSLSEGANMQHAGAVVLLDMPSVLRLAEQRVGRIDRLNSPHARITAYWPDDPPAFRLRSDRRLFSTVRLTDRLLGGNLEPPAELAQRYEDLEEISAEDAIALAKETDEDAEWEGVQDAFAGVRALKEGPTALITEQQYADYLRVKATVRCRVSYAEAQAPWAFFAFRGTEHRAPRWVFLDEASTLLSDYSAVCAALRERLRDVRNVEHNGEQLKHVLELLRVKERAALPHKKRRTLHAAEHLLERQLQYEEAHNGANRWMLNELLALFKPSTGEDAIDLEAFASHWQDALAPLLETKRRERKRRREFVSVLDLCTNRKQSYFTTEQLRRIRDGVTWQQSLEAQVAACVVGVVNISSQ